MHDLIDTVNEIERDQSLPRPETDCVISSQNYITSCNTLQGERLQKAVSLSRHYFVDDKNRNQNIHEFMKDKGSFIRMSQTSRILFTKKGKILF